MDEGAATGPLTPSGSHPATLARYAGTMRAAPILAPALALVSSAVLAAAAHASDDVQYRPDGFLRTGYSDRQVAPDVWRVKGSSHAAGGGVAVALYRAAELAMAAHADELRVTSQKVRSLTMTRRIGNEIVAFTETATVTVRAVRTDADRAACDEKDARQCMTLPVAGLLARFGDQVGRPAARPGEAPARPVALVTYNPRFGPAPWQVEAARRWPEPVAIPVRPTPGLALLLGRMVSGTGRSAASAPIPVPFEATPARATRPVPIALRRPGPATPQLSAAEIERARLQAAAATDGDARQGRVLVR